MTPWQSERWAGVPTNDGRNFAPAHRWRIMPARPLCFGLRETLYHVEGMPCEDCDDREFLPCPHANVFLRHWASPEARTAALARSYIREAHELRNRIATLEAENAALRGKQPRCPDCGHRLDTEECGCGGDA